MNRRVLCLIGACILLISTSGAILAHEERTVGDLVVVAGFLTEPAFEGIRNGVSIRITKPNETEHHHKHEHDEDGEHGHVPPSNDGKKQALSQNDADIHGMLFSPGVIESGKSFLVQVQPNWNSLEIPFHKHPGQNLGTLFVVDSAGSSRTVEIEIREDGFHPSQLSVEIGSQILLSNTSGEAQSVFSGLPGKAMPATSQIESNYVPVLGLEELLKVEVTHKASGVASEMSLRVVSGDPGHYVANFIPTVPGDYSFRIFGAIDGQEIDETFESGPNTFDAVQSISVIQFPFEVSSDRELEAAVRGMTNSATEADSRATYALTLSIFGTVLGVIGVAAGATALYTMRRQ